MKKDYERNYADKPYDDPNRMREGIVLQEYKKSAVIQIHLIAGIALIAGTLALTQCNNASDKENVKTSYETIDKKFEK